MSSIVNSVVAGVVQPITTQLLSQLNALPQTFSFAGSNCAFGVVSGITGGFSSLLAATGSFGSVSSSQFYNSNQQLLTQSQRCLVWVGC